MTAAQAGDRDALAALVDEFTPTVLGTAFGLCGDWHLAGDIAQEAFATVVTRIGEVRDPAAFPGWLMAVVRTSARRQRPMAAISIHAAAEPSPEDLVVARDDARRVRRAVEALKADLRLPMVLHYFAGCPLQEIADLCELPLSTVKKRMRTARARLREGIDDMTDQLRPEAGTDPSDTIRMYTAMRSGDIERVGRILDARPDLVDVREDWTRAESFAHRLPWTRGGGTPLLRAVERGDVAMVRLLLARGADVDGACTCDGGESPLWVATVQRETPIVEELLRCGANPNASAFAGTSAIDIARRRGYDEIVAMLRAAGASASPVDEGGAVDVPAGATGIKAIDLWCPLPERGLAHLTPGFGLGAVVLIAELSHVTDIVTVSMAAPTASIDEQVAALDRGIAIAGDDAFVVVFAETGRTSAVEERLPALAARPALTLVVSPLDGSVPQPLPVGSPYLASITFDIERAKRGRWPAISSASWSKVADVDIADRARAGMTDALDDYLSQPFFIAEPVMGKPGESVSIDELRSAVDRLVVAGAVGVHE